MGVNREFLREVAVMMEWVLREGEDVESIVVGTPSSTGSLD